MDQVLPIPQESELPLSEQSLLRIVLVDNLLIGESWDPKLIDLNPHLGLLSLAAVAEAAGHHVDIYDPKIDIAFGRVNFNQSAYHEIARQILRLKPDVVGFTALGCSFICALKIARYIKMRKPTLPTLLGGPHASILHEQIAKRFQEFDVIVRHEAEESFLPVLRGLSGREFSGIPGVTWRRGDEIVVNEGKPIINNLDSLPFPSYHLTPLRELGLTRLRVEAGRGCPFRCTFCSTASFFGRQYRLKSAHRLVADLDRLHDTYNVTDFQLSHDLFTVSKKKVAEFCSTVQGKGYTWRCSARADCVDDELLERMRDAGCRSIYFGIEAGSQSMQQRIEKDLDVTLVIPRIRRAITLGMDVTASFITGYTDETQADQDASIDLLEACVREGEVTVQLHLLAPEPGTAMYEEMGSRLIYDGNHTDLSFPTIEDDDTDLIKNNPTIFPTQHYYPTTYLERRRNLITTSLIPVLFSLGRNVSICLINQFGNLSTLVKHLCDWICTHTTYDSVTARTFEAFLDDSFGSQSPLVSVARYIFKCQALAKASDTRPTSQDAYGAFQLSKRAAVLRGIHDVTQLLTEIESNGEFKTHTELPTATSDFVIVVPHSGKLTAECYHISPETCVFLEKFESPRAINEIVESCAGFDVREALKQFIQSLIERRILVPALRSDPSWVSRNSNGGTFTQATTAGIYN